MEKNRDKQRGITTTSFISLMLLLAFFIYVFLKLFPLYMESFKVTTIIKSFEKEGVLEKSNAEILKLIEKRLDINNMKLVDKGNFNITRESGKVTINADAELREQLIGDIHIILVVQKSQEYSR